MYQVAFPSVIFTSVILNVEINPQGTIPSQGDTIAPLKFNAEAGADNKKGGVSEAMMKKMEITFKKKFEKTGVVKELRARQSFEKPCITKRMQKIRAAYRQQMQRQEMEP